MIIRHTKLMVAAFVLFSLNSLTCGLSLSFVTLRTERFFISGTLFSKNKTALRFTAASNVLNGRFAPKSAKDDFSVKDIFICSFSLEENSVKVLNGLSQNKNQKQGRLQELSHTGKDNPDFVTLRTERFFISGTLFSKNKTALRFTAASNVLNGRFAPKSAEDDFSVKGIFLHSFSLKENKKNSLTLHSVRLNELK